MVKISSAVPSKLISQSHEQIVAKDDHSNGSKRENKSSIALKRPGFTRAFLLASPHDKSLKSAILGRMKNKNQSQSQGNEL